MGEAMIGAPPREGLPPCIRHVAFEGRLASFSDRSLCTDSNHWLPRRFSVYAAAETSGFFNRAIHDNPLCARIPLTEGIPVVDYCGDDEAEAERAWEKAEHWVRTGELP